MSDICEKDNYFYAWYGLDALQENLFAQILSFAIANKYFSEVTLNNDFTFLAETYPKFCLNCFEYSFVLSYAWITVATE